MPIWKTSENILNIEKDGEYFDENWMNYKSISQYAPKIIPWKENRPIKFEDVDLWEVITEESMGRGMIGVYAAYMPYAEYYIVTHKWTILHEFEGYLANERLEKFLIENNIHYPYTDKSPTPEEQRFVENSIMVTNNFSKKL